MVSLGGKVQAPCSLQTEQTLCARGRSCMRRVFFRHVGLTQAAQNSCSFNLGCTLTHGSCAVRVCFCHLGAQGRFCFQGSGGFSQAFSEIFRFGASLDF